MSVVIEAQRSGPCEACNEGIHRGQKIQPLPDGGWEHTRCPEPRPICGECFTEKSVTGACMCEATS
jgi:hypothetical protein